MVWASLIVIWVVSLTSTYGVIRYLPAILLPDVGRKVQHSRFFAAGDIRIILVSILITGESFALFGITHVGMLSMIFQFSLVALAFIDIETDHLPDMLTLPLLWIGLLVNARNGFSTLPSSVYGAVAGYLLLRVFCHLYWLMTGQFPIGHGDFKMLAAIGAWLGIQALPSTLGFAVAAGLVTKIVLMLTGQENGSERPFGPAIAFGGAAALVARYVLMG